MGREWIHYGIHLGLPILVAFFFYPKKPWFALMVLLAALAIDADHLLAHPVFDPNRCSIGYHPLHSYPAIAGYLGLALWRKTRLAGIGLLIHILADSADCGLLLLQS